MSNGEEHATADAGTREPDRDTADEDAGEDADREELTAHLDDVDDGCGCAEVWEHMSDQREG